MARVARLTEMNRINQPSFSIVQIFVSRTPNLVSTVRGKSLRPPLLFSRATSVKSVPVISDLTNGRSTTLERCVFQRQNYLFQSRSLYFFFFFFSYNHNVYNLVNFSFLIIISYLDSQ